LVLQVVLEQSLRMQALAVLGVLVRWVFFLGQPQVRLAVLETRAVQAMLPLGVLVVRAVLVGDWLLSLLKPLMGLVQF
jgi:hypothetical protein